uniref:Uncharacterized protein n=1 Tax=Arundo donax TaxID=35708 RepID=A0A0A9C7R8_ARUDO
MCFRGECCRMLLLAPPSSFSRWTLPSTVARTDCPSPSILPWTAAHTKLLGPCLPSLWKELLALLSGRSTPCSRQLLLHQGPGH